MTECSSTMLWLDVRSRQAANRCRHACFGGSDHPFGSDISPLWVLLLLKMKREANIVSTLYIDMIECSSTMLWLNFTSRQAVNRCRYACLGGSEHPFGSDISPLCVLPFLKMKREPNIVSILYIDMTEGSPTMFWLNFRSRQAVNRCYCAGFGGSEHPFGSNISPLCVLPLLKMKREPNIVSILYIDMTECSSTILWLDFRSRQAANWCRYACSGGSDHPFGSDISPLWVLPLLKMK